VRGTLLTLCVAIGLVALHAPAQEAAKPARGIEVANLDPAVKPCEDFFQYANGTWLKTAQIPAEYPVWGAGLEVYERNMALLKTLLEGAAKDTASPKGSAIQKVGDFYASGMDEGAIEKAGLTPLSGRFEAIEKMKTPADLAPELARLHMEGISAGFGFGVGVDDKASSSNIVILTQGGLGLPDRDYYTKEDEGSKELRAKYVAHVAKTFELLGDKPEAAKREAAAVMALETRLAKASMTQVEQRDPQATYHKMDRAELARTAPGFDWEAFFSQAGVPASEKSVLVRQPVFFKELGTATKGVPLADWQAYLRWNLVRSTSGQLPSAFVNEHFDFYGKTLTGVAELSPRWKRVQETVGAEMGEAVGQLYVAKAFPPQAKARALEMVKNLQAALADRIRALDWMTPATKEKALYKLGRFIVKIGYPDTWRDYSKLSIDRGPYVLNCLAADAFEMKRRIGKLGKPVDRTEWLMSPQEVNAYYEPTTNEICFPAGILQPPFFDAAADDAVNYGAIGMVIGHEMTHGFDDQGCQYDADGNLKNWWTDADNKAYKAKQDLVVRQYNAFKPLPDQAINGELTLGENIADLGGIKIAYAALVKALEGKPKPPAVDGFSWEQRFFLGYAQSWRDVERPEFLKVQLSTDPHSAPKFRVNGPLADLPEFYAAFSCAEGAPMWRPQPERPTIW
jgi:putative endopeptidase